jgi:hypothetical protein
MTPISPWKQLSSYVAMAAVSFGMSLCRMPILSLLGSHTGTHLLSWRARRCVWNLRSHDLIS